MKNILISGGCGFVGRNMVRRLAEDTNNRILFIDDLSVGDHADEWLDYPKVSSEGNISKYGENGRLIFIKDDFRNTLFNLNNKENYLNLINNLAEKKFDELKNSANGILKNPTAS